MSHQDRREFLSKSMALGMAPIFTGTSLSSPEATADSMPAQQGPAEFFSGFKREQIKTSGTTINTVYGGKGSPILLLHGIPETHILWRKVAPLLQQDYFLVIPDLRGYGDSGKPPGGDDHFGYSKRAMAQDMVEVMNHLGFQKFAVVGHDRGGRASHRMALDHPEVLTKLVILDIVPTYTLYQNITKEFATIFYHWFLLVQPPPFPETLVANSAEYFLKSHAICEDYRAAASIDLEHDKVDLNKKIECPLLVLWSENGPFHRMYDVLQTWKDRAKDAQGKPLPTGHFLPEQVPQELTRELKSFLSA